MDAEIYHLDAIRSQRSIRTFMEKTFLTSANLAGLALTRSATLFWVEYVQALASFHAQLFSAACSTSSKPPRILGST